MRLIGEPVLDEREIQELFRIEHRGLWLMFALLSAAVLVQLLLGAPLVQIAGELAVILVVSVVMIVANVRHGIWELGTRPSMKGNALSSLGASVAVAAVVTLMRGRLWLGLAAGAAMFAPCFGLLSLLMAFVRRRQERQSRELDGDSDGESYGK